MIAVLCRCCIIQSCNWWRWVKMNRVVLYIHSVHWLIAAMTCVLWLCGEQGLLHLWVMIVLLTYQPEIHGNMAVPHETQWRADLFIQFMVTFHSAVDTDNVGCVTDSVGWHWLAAVIAHRCRISELSTSQLLYQCLVNIATYLTHTGTVILAWTVI